MIVGRTEGLARNEWLLSDLELGDFRLVVEVKLTPDQENSGIQFRSHATGDREVAGYQADAGAGWWGKLYDEHGRGLLHEQGADGAVRSDEWNTYEIVAVGDRVLTAINGRRCVDYTDEEDRSRGQVALQMHSGGALEVRFRIRSLELDPEMVLITEETGGR